MAAWDNVTLPRAPEAPSYATPLVDFSNIGNLGNQYFQGQEQNQKLRQQQAFANGLPRDAQGNLDVKAITEKMLQLGGTPTAPAAIQLGQQQQLLDTLRGDGSQPQSQPREPIPSHGIPAQPPQRQGGDEQGSVMDAVGAAGVPESEAGKVANTIAGRLGIDPNAAITDPRMATSVQNQLKAYRGPQPQQPTQTAQAPAGGLLPPEYTAGNAAQLRRQGDELARRSSIIDALRPGTKAGEPLMKQAEELYKRADNIDKARLEHGPEAMSRKGQEALQGEKIKRSMKTYEGINAQATQYEADMRPYVTLSKSLLNDPAMYSGIGGQWSLDINRVRAAFGDQKAAQLQEALQKVTANTVLGQINQQRNEMMEAGSNSGRLFAQQVSQVEKAAPQLATTLGGNRFLVEVQQRIGDLATKRAEMAREYLRTHQMLDEGFDGQLSKWMRANPLFKKEELANPALVGAPEVPEGIAAGGSTKVTVWAQQMRLGPNDVVRTHDGRYVRPLPVYQSAPPNSAIAAPQQQM